MDPPTGSVPAAGAPAPPDFPRPLTDLRGLAAAFPVLDPLLSDTGPDEAVLAFDPDRGVRLVFAERGRFAGVPAPLFDSPSFVRLCAALATAFDADPGRSPFLDARLSDGSRLALCCPPASRVRVLTIRPFRLRPPCPAAA